MTAWDEEEEDKRESSNRGILGTKTELASREATSRLWLTCSLKIVFLKY